MLFFFLFWVQSDIEYYAAAIGAAQGALEQNRVMQTEKWLQRCKPSERGFEWHYLKAKANQAIRSEMTQGAPVMEIDHHPTLAVLAFAHDDGHISICKTNGEEIRRWLGHPPQAYSVAFSPDGKQLMTSGRDKKVKIWDWQKGDLILTYDKHEQVVPSAVWSSKPDLVASCSYRRLKEAPYVEAVIHLWNPKTGELNLELLFGHHPIAELAFAPDGNRLAAASWEEKVAIWQAPDPKPKMVFETRKNGYAAMNCLAFDESGKWLAAGGKDRSVLLFDLEKKEQLARLEGHSGWVNDVTFSPDGTSLVSASVDQTIRVWSLVDFEPQATLFGHTGSISALNWHEGNLLSTGSDRQLKTWAFAQARRGQGRSLPDSPYGISFHPLGHVAVVTLANGDAAILDSNTMTPIRTWQMPSWVNDPFYSSDGFYLVLPGGDGAVRVRHALTHEPIAEVQAHQGGIARASYSEDGQFWAFAARDGKVTVWNREAFLSDNPKPEFVVEQKGFGLTTVAFSANQEVFVATTEPKMKVFNLKGEELREFPLIHSVSDMVFRGQHFFLSSSNHDVISKWELDGQKVLDLQGHSQNVNFLTLNPDKTRLVSGGADFSLKIWEPESGEELLHIQKDVFVYQAKFSPSGDQLVTAFLHPKFQVFDARPMDRIMREQSDKNDMLEAAKPFLEKKRAAYPDPRVLGETLLLDKFISPKMKQAALTQLIAVEE